MDNWQHDGFTDIEHRRRLSQSQGFCLLHTWQLAQRHYTSQLAFVYRDVLADVFDGLDRDYKKLPPGDERESRQAATWKVWWRKWRSRMRAGPAHELCPICRIRLEAEARYVAILLQQLRSEEMRALLVQSTGLCLIHFKQARKLVEVIDPIGLHRLLECQRRCIQRILSEVEEMLRKDDYRFRKEPRGNEMTSWRRAAKLCAGNPGVR
jgi:hypothetical protein